MIVSNLNELKEIARSTPFISYDSAKIVYIIGDWDGAWDGLIKWNNKDYYFVCYNDDLDHTVMSIREYVLIDMTKNQREELQRFSHLFDEKNKFVANSLSEHKQTAWSSLDDFYSDYLENAKKYSVDKGQIVARWSFAHK